MSASWKRGLATTVSIGMVGALLAGCSTPSPSTGQQMGATSRPVEGGQITVDMTQAVPDLDPAVAFDTTSAEVLQQVYEPLVTYKGGTDQITGDLAKNWSISKDGKTYTFHLRKGVTFSNGDPMTAQDFVFELKRILNPNMQPKPSPGSGFFMNIVGAQAFVNGKSTDISGVSTPNDHTITFRLIKPQQFFLKILAMQFLSAVDPKFVKQHGNAAMDTTAAMGTGPFEVKLNSSSQVILVKNPHYWQKDKYGQRLPYLNQITFNVNNDTQVDAMHWEKGQTALLSPWLMGGDGIPGSVYPIIMDSPKLRKYVMQRPMNAIYYIGLNVKKEINGKPNPLSNLKVRQAIEYGFNREMFVKINNGAVQPANQPLPSSLAGYVNHLNPSAQYSYNPAKAKQLLKEAGYANGLTLDMWNENLDTSKEEDQAFQAMMKKIGITVNLHEVSWSDFLAEDMSGNAQIVESAWQQDFPDASDFLDTLFNSSQIPENNTINYSNPQVDQWLNQAEYLNNAQERDQLYAKVINQVMSDATWVPTYQLEGHWCVQPWLHGFYTSSVIYDPFAYTWVDPSHRS
ncbi:ABC transporter substrate-binding protein [Alicyclobacillus fodiniaquatilis]|uniref:ABC transporter substrate-binding protein n=1 Tax=Alicyclobacillus fodiniaquatilis TaxID=1661150 RepID=A0ABW4JE97_9BACL